MTGKLAVDRRFRIHRGDPDRETQLGPSRQWCWLVSGSVRVGRVAAPVMCGCRAASRRPDSEGGQKRCETCFADHPRVGHAKNDAGDFCCEVYATRSRSLDNPRARVFSPNYITKTKNGEGVPNGRET